MISIINITTIIVCISLLLPSSDAFTGCSSRRTTQISRSSMLFMSEAEEGINSAPMVTGEQLEMMLTEWDSPLVIDAYATWCGPCLLMSPEFEAAAKDLEGKVRFVKLDTDKEEEMATRLAINGLPTLLFLDKFTPPKGSASDDESSMSEEEQNATAVLKGRLEGALRKDDIMNWCEHYFFDGPEPKL
mmetsp:Transcript_65275/g.73109  ORF Transcript_65275/g.73109 Transcript_65275/m.73109 type:complete len:188 (+) Transcript_65275:94-657(+)